MISKTNKALFPLLLLSMFWAADSSFAGGALNGGGGGGAVLCLNADQSVRSARLVDVVEAEFYDQVELSVSLSSRSWQEQLEMAVQRLAFVDPNFSRALKFNVSHVLDLIPGALRKTRGRKIVFPAPQDLSHGRAPPMELGCQLVGVAAYSDESDEGGRWNGDSLTISELVWEKLSEMDKAALALHEALYLMHRTQSNATDSAASRKLVGYAFSRELESKNRSEQERSLFKGSGAYRSVRLGYVYWDPTGFDLSNLEKLIKPFLPYYTSDIERPIYLDKDSCAGAELKVVVSSKGWMSVPKASCELGGWSGGTKNPRVVAKLSLDDKFERKEMRYTPEADSEAVVLSCTHSAKNEVFNPGFELFCGSEKLAEIRGEWTKFGDDHSHGGFKRVGLPIGYKNGRRNAFLSNSIGSYNDSGP